MDKIYYKKGYKYQLSKEYDCKIEIKPEEKILSDYIELDADGTLLIKKGYAWDGPSGPTIDTKNFMRGSLIHDALYQLIREQHLSEQDREQADNELYEACREDGMSRIRAWYVHRSVRRMAGFAADPDNAKEEHVAP